MRRHLDREGSPCPGHLNNEQDNRQGLPHIAEGDGERVDDIDKHHARQHRRQHEFRRLQALDLQQVEVSQRHNKRLRHTEQHKDEVPSKVFFIRLTAMNFLVLHNAALQNSHQDQTAHPYGENRVKRSHGRTVIFNGIDLILLQIHRG